MEGPRAPRWATAPFRGRARADCRSAVYHRASVATELETTSSRDATWVEPEPQRAPATGYAPVVALGAVVVGAFVVYTLLSTGVDGPRVHPDEELYTMAASSLVAGQGLTLRGEHFGFGPLLPVMLAAIIRLAGNVDAAYGWFKAANALWFALTAVPVYLLARRLVSGWWAVLAAALAVAIPSSISIGTVMTESISFLATTWALYAIALALERPSVLRQLGVLAATAAAFLARPQFGILFVTWIGALALLWVIAPPTRPRTRTDIVRFWPTALPIVVVATAFSARLASGAAASGSFGAYAVLWRGYDPFEVGKWFVYHLGDFAVYLAIVPVAVAPVVLWRLAREGRDGSRPAAAFVALFVSANVTGLLVVAAFASSPWGFDRLHDRYGFYLLPLWLIGFVVWLASGLPRPLLATAVGVALAVALPLILPFGQLANEAGIDTVPGAFWARIQERTAGPGPASGTLALALFVAALLAATCFLPRRIARIALPVAVAGTLVVTSYFAWERMAGAPEDEVFAGGFDRAWIDERVSGGASVTKLYADTSCGSALQRHALYLTEFFNSTVDRAAYLDGSVPDGLPSKRVDVARSGTLELSPGNPLVAEYVYTQPGIELAGRRVADGTAAHLVLWHVAGPVRVVGASTNAQLRRNACA
jgi:Dolichyl-phosphate-mannose-protein mannosyltransferase